MTELLPSASGLDRSIACPASCVLPRISSSSEAAERGTAFHNFIERILQGMVREVALDHVPAEYKEWCSLFDVNAALGCYDPNGDILYVEQPFAIDPVAGTVRLLPKTEHRDYLGVTPTEFYGTVDLICRDTAGNLVVNDWKTGRDLGDPRRKMQLRFFSLAMYMLHGVTKVNQRFTYIHEDGSSSAVGADVDAIDFEVTRDELKKLYASITGARRARDAGKTLTVTTGDHCQYCSSWAYCPAKAGIVRRVIPDLEVLEERLAAMTAEELGVAWTKYRELQDCLKRVENVLKERAKTDPLPLPDGRVVRALRQSKSSIDATRALALAKKYGALDWELDSCIRTTSYDVTREVKK